MQFAPIVKRGFSPLDEELGLLPGHLTPSLQQHTTQLGGWIPFGRVGKMLQGLLGTGVSEATVRRCTERHGRVYEDVQTAAVVKIEKELPEPPAGAHKQLLSIDGAMVPLVGGEWAEVKTLVLGEIGEAVMEGGEQVVHSTALSYFSRLTDAETFQRLALVETQRRGVETAQHVIAPADGAIWIQGFLDYHRADAERILDFGHAAEYVAVIGSAVGAPGSAAFKAWLSTSLHTLKHEGATALLPELRILTAAHPERVELANALAYLEKRTAMMDYPEYQRQGWPIGSGSVESANKVVVEARLKGAGMHWARQHVNPMLSLRNAVCNERWDEAWADIATDHQLQRRERYRTRAQRKTVASQPSPSCEVSPLSEAPAATEIPPSTSRKSRRPAANHPWRRWYTSTPSQRSPHAEN